MTVEIETGVVSILPSFDNFRTELETKLAANVKTVKPRYITVNANLNSAKYKREAAKAFSDQTVNVVAALDAKAASEAKAGIAALVRTQVVKIQVEVDQASLVAAGNAIRRQTGGGGSGGSGGPPLSNMPSMHGTGASGDKGPAGGGTPPPPPVGRHRGSGRGGGGSGGSGRGGISSFGQAGFSAVTSFGVATAALAPIVQVAAGAVLALGSSFAVAGTAAAGFGVAAVGHIKRIVDTMKLLETGRQFNIGGPLGETIEKVKGLKDAYNSLLTQTEGPVLGVFNQALTIASNNMPKLTGLVNAGAAGISGSLNVIDQAIQSSEFNDFLSFVQREAPNAMVSFTNSAKNVAFGIFDIIQAFSGLSSSALGGLEGITAKFATWASGLSETQGFKDFITFIRTEGPGVASAIGEIASAALAVGKAFAVVGVHLLKVVSGFAQIISAVPTPVLAVLVGALIATKVGMYGMSVATRIATASMKGLEVGATLATRATNVLKTALLRTGIGVAVVALGYLAEKFLSSGDSAETGAEGISTFTANTRDLAEALVTANGVLDENIRLIAAKKLTEAGLFESTSFIGLTPKQLNDMFLGSDAAWKTGVIDPLEKRKAEVDARIKELDAMRADPTPPTPQDADYAYVAKRRFDLQSTREADEASSQGLGETINKAKQLKQTLNSDTAAIRTENSAAKELGATYLKTAAGAAEFNTRLLNTFNTAMQPSAYEAMGDAIQSASRGIRDAQRGVADAIRNRGRVAEDTARAEIDSAKAIVTAQEGVVTAHEAVADAQQAIKDAINGVTEAQKRLTEAREDAKRKLRDQPDTEESLRLALADAEIVDLQTSGLAANNLDRRRAVLSLKNAKEDLQDFMADRIDSIDQDKGVIDAQKGVEDSHERVADAQGAVVKANKNLKKAQEDVTTAIRNNTRTIEDGRQARADAQRQVETATERLGDAEAVLDNVQQALIRVGNDAGVTGTKLDGINGTYTAQILADGTDADKKIRTTRQYLEALRLAALHLDWDAAKVWAQADKNITALDAPKPPPKPPSSNIPKPKKPRPGHQDDFATGGPVRGQGGWTTDSIPARLSNDEHVWTAREVRAAGGHSAVEDIRRGVLRRATGGAIVLPDVAQAAITAGLLGEDRKALTVNGLYADLSSRMASDAASRETGGDFSGEILPMPAGGRKYNLGAVNPRLNAIASIIGNMFGISLIGGWRSSGSVATSDHPKGLALDFMTDNLGKPALENPIGQLLANHVQANRAKYGVTYEIWNEQWLPEGANKWGPYTGPSDHRDHVHVSFKKAGGKGLVDAAGNTNTVAEIAEATARSMGASDKVLLALMETGIVESGMRNLDYGDRDSLGFLQQRPSQGWGTPAQVQNVPYATRSFVSRAMKKDRPNITAGQLAQAVQISAFPDKYDKVRARAMAYLNAVAPGIGSIVADNGAVLRPHSTTMVTNNTSQPEQVGFPMSRNQMIEFAKLIAQALQTAPTTVEMDGEVVARKAVDAVGAVLGMGV